jgi:hypothetical protein
LRIFEGKLALAPDPLEDRVMTLLRLHHDDVRSFARKERLPLRQLLRWIGRAFRVLHQSIVRAKLRRLQSEMLFRRDYDEMFSPEKDASKFPQRPLILGDKWDF